MRDPRITLPEESGIAGLPFSVVRIRTEDSAGRSSLGTGFFMAFPIGEHTIAVLVSNRHVLADAEWYEFGLGFADEAGLRVLEAAHTVRLHKKNLPVWLHPNPAVDLAVAAVAPILGAKPTGRTPHFVQFSGSMFPREDEISNLGPSSTVLMVGFPTGLMDEHNNLPLVRKGSLATPYRADYQGRPEFVVDIAAFPGSSGSPILGVSELVRERAGQFQFAIAPEIVLLGVLYAGPCLTLEGEVVVGTGFSARTDVMVHLGYCIKARELAVFRRMIGEQLIAEGKIPEDVDLDGPGLIPGVRDR